MSSCEKNSASRNKGDTYDPFQPRTGHALAWNKVTVKKGGKIILDRLSGESKPTQITAVIGHSGSGKTTLLRALAGRGTFSSGNIAFNGALVNPTDLNYQQALAFVADHSVFEKTATCNEAIRFSARLRLPSTFSDDTIDRITSTILKELLLDKCAQTQCGFLSAGEKRRTSLGTELVVRAGIVILDEPTSGLDR